MRRADTGSTHACRGHTVWFSSAITLCVRSCTSLLTHKALSCALLLLHCTCLYYHHHCCLQVPPQSPLPFALARGIMLDTQFTSRSLLLQYIRLGAVVLIDLLALFLATWLFLVRVMYLHCTSTCVHCSSCSFSIARAQHVHMYICTVLTYRPLKHQLLCYELLQCCTKYTITAVTVAAPLAALCIQLMVSQLLLLYCTNTHTHTHCMHAGSS
jgi:hypothetical protein